MALNIGDLYGTIDLQDSFSMKMGAIAGVVGSLTTRLTDGLFNVLGSLPRAFDAAVERGGRFSDLALQFSTTAESLQLLEAAGKPVGVGIETITRASLMLGRQLTSNQGAFEKYGLSVEKLSKMDAGERLNEVLTVVSKMNNPLQQQAALFELTRDRGGAMLKLVRSEFQKAQEDAKNFGLVLSDKVINDLDNFGDSTELLGTVMSSLGTNLVASIASSGALGTVIRITTELFGKLSKWIQNNQDTVRQWIDTAVIFAIDALTTLATGALPIAIDGFSLLRVTIAAGVAGFQVIAAAATFAKDVLAGSPKEAEQAWSKFVVSQKLATDDFQKTMGDIKTQNTKLREVGESAAIGMVRLADRVREGALATNELGNASKKTSSAFNTDLKAMQDAVTKLGDELDKALLQQSAAGMTGLQAELAKGENQVAEWSKKVEALVKQGADPKAIEEMRYKIDLLTESLAANALQAEKIKVFGKGVQEVNADMDNLVTVFAKAFNSDMTTISNAQLVQMISNLQKMVELGGDNEQATKLLAQAMQEASNRGDAVAEKVGLVGDRAKDAIDHFQKIVTWSDKWKITVDKILGTEAGIVDLLGAIGLGSTNVAEGMKASSQWTAQFETALEDAHLTVGEILSLAGGIVDGFNKATDSASGLSRAVGGMQFGAQIGSEIGGIFGPQGAVIGAVVGGLSGAIAGFFHEPSWKKAGREAGEILGVNISEEMAKKIEEMSKKLDVSIATAALLSIDAVAEEMNKSVTEFAGQIGTLMQGVANGTIPAKEGLEEIDTLFQKLGEEGTAAAEKLQTSMLQQAMAYGQLTDSMKKFAEEAVNQIIAGSEKIVQGVAMIGKDVPMGQMGTDAANFFVAGFQAKIAEGGILAAITEMGGDITTFYDKLISEGNTAAAEMLAPFVQLSAVINNETDPTLKGFLLTLQGMSEVFSGIDKLGFATTETFNGLSNAVLGTANALQESGVTGIAQYQALAPQLAQIIAASEKYGFAIDNNTQALIDEARQAGVSFPTDPMQKMVDILIIIARQLGADIPNAMEQGANTMRQKFTETSTTMSHTFDQANQEMTDSYGQMKERFNSDTSAMSTTFNVATSQMKDHFTTDTTTMSVTFGSAADQMIGDTAVLSAQFGFAAGEMTGDMGRAAGSMVAEMRSLAGVTDGVASSMESEIGSASWNMMGSLGALGNYMANDIPTFAQRGAGGISNAFSGVRINIPVRYNVENPPEGVDVPAFGTGGLAMRPILGLIGEAGPEAVMPLEDLYGMLRQRDETAANRNGNSTGGNQAINITVPLQLEGRVVDQILIQRNRAGLWTVKKESVR